MANDVTKAELAELRALAEAMIKKLAALEERLVVSAPPPTKPEKFRKRTIKHDPTVVVVPTPEDYAFAARWNAKRRQRHLKRG